ncbi:MAG: DUF3987 domain-containing protein [Reyranella sp.]|uniref:DUF3987 domain-containing protein n=1 Tax=Reyranella sp. TaxID=1929291 RepID=UPI001AC745B1|nr:DUF3987 domain-containing protein [Reyranella sp.]MBN9087023.1 DUF3987 domain-containing protein [Reyranella sp.]
MSIANPEVAETACAPWPELDRRFLQRERRAVPPPFPLEVIPEAWRSWIEGYALASTCIDYVAQALLAAVSAVCGSRMVVDVTPHWREPLVLWQALVGAPSTGKTAALVAGRRLLGSVKAPPDPPVVEEKPPRDGPVLTAWMLDRGLSRWFDDCDWLGAMSRDKEDRPVVVAGWTGDPSHCAKFLEVGKRDARWAKSILGTLQADRLAETLSGVDDGLLSRLLYCWPVPGLDARLDRATGEGETVSRLLQRLVDLPGTICEPATLALEDAAIDRLQALLPPLRAFMREADGAEAAWIGKAAGTIVRLAGLLSLMDWAAGDARVPCTTVDERHVERAHALWRDYYWPHAQAVFGQASPTIAERRVRRVGRWLQRTRPQVVSREDVRREALGDTANAETAESVIERLEQYGVVRLIPTQAARSGGRPRRRWEVNPELWAG